LDDASVERYDRAGGHQGNLELFDGFGRIAVDGLSGRGQAKKIFSFL
jgi:hypothetical protein